jgi:hypothetical protein
LAFPTPEKLEAIAVPSNESFRPHDGQGVSPIKPPTEPHQRQAHGAVDPSRPDFAFLIETELFAQEEILGGQRSFGPKTKEQQAEQIGKQVQPVRTDVHDAARSFVFDLLLSLWLLASPFQVIPLIFAEHRYSPMVF